MTTRKTLAAEFDAHRITWDAYLAQLHVLELEGAELGEPAWLTAVHGVSS